MPRVAKTRIPTLGLLTTKLESSYQAPIWRNIADVARQRGANLMSFVGGILGGMPSSPYDVQGNILYDLPGPDNVDGLIIISSSLGTFLSYEEMAAFCQRYAPLPMVSIGIAIEGIPSVTTDSAPGLRNALLHLIRDHGLRRIAFIRGPAGHLEAELRYAIYCETLRSEGIPLDLDLVAPGDFQPVSPLVHRYLEQIHDFPEAIVAANDGMAMTVLQELPRYGLRVPDDIAVVGFDDSSDSRYSSPPLTTVRQQIAEMGSQAAHLCLDLLEGKPVPPLTVLPTALVLRRSCGCQMQNVANAAVSHLLDADPSGAASMALAAADCRADHLPVRRLDLAFEESLASRDARAFLQALEHDIAAAPSVDVTVWQDLISAMRRTWVPRLLHEPALRSASERLVFAEDVWGQARVLITTIALSIEDAERTRQSYLAEAVRATGEALTTTFQVDELMEAVSRNLPILDIPACHVALYEEAVNETDPWQLIPASPPPPEAGTALFELPEHVRRSASVRQTASARQSASVRLVLACEKATGRSKELEGTRFPARSILPAPALQRHPYNKIIYPLYFREHQLGFAVFETGPLEATVYDSLRDHMSNAIRGSMLLQELGVAYDAVEQRVMNRTAELQREIAERQQVERVRAALYRISEAAHSAQNPEDVYPVIHEIVGELMPARNFYIALYDPQTEIIAFPYFVDEHDPPPQPKQAGGGLTELVIRSGEPLLVDPDGFDALVAAGKVLSIGAPSLDWIGVPLMVRGQVIGALVIQTYDPAIRFDEEDRDVLVFVSTQIATALKRVEAEAERQHLFSALQERNTHLRTAAEVSKSALIYLDPRELMHEAVQLIQDRFGFYYVGLFLKDKGDPDSELGQAVLAAGTGEVGKRMVEEGHRLPIDDTSMVGWCIKHAEARIASDVDKENNRFANPWLPATRSEVALPLISQSQGCLAALSVQSDEPNAFNEADVAALQTMADHLAIAIENARLHDEIRRYAGELEARVAERTAELVATNRELASFSYSVSHDLRAPLRSIDGFSQALIEDFHGSLDDTGRDYLQRIRRATQRMGQLIDDLLKLSRISRGELHRGEVNLSEMATEVLGELLDRTPERHMQVDITPRIYVTGDARLLRIAMENLLGNAWKFSSRQQQAKIAFGATTLGGERAFYIQDNGVGFDMAYADKLFGAFQRLHTTDEFEGTGIGLATVQRIIHRHGGRIWAHGEVGAGATFYFTVPQHGIAGVMESP